MNVTIYYIAQHLISRKKVTIVMNPVSHEMSTGKGENTSHVSRKHTVI